MKPNYVLFGAGVTGLAAVNYFNREQIVAVIDNYPGKIGTLFEGIQVISFEDYLKKYKGLQIIISIYSRNYFDVRKQLERGGIFNYFTAPPVLYGFDSPERLAEKLLLKKPEKIVFYGINPISIRMHEWIKKNDDRKCYFINPVKTKMELMYEKSLIYISLYDLSEKDTVVITTNEVEEHIREKISTRFSGKIYDIYEDALPSHPELIAYKNKYKGQRCFIIGNGPSLRSQDLDKINEFKENSFASNRIYLIYEQTKWRPTYYVVIDIMGVKEYIQKYADSSFFIADYHYTGLKKIEGINYLSMINKIYDDDRLCFSNDITVGVASGRTVTYTMIQLACYMGFSDIYLLGVDFTWGENGSDTHFCKTHSSQEEDKYQRTQAVLDKEEIHQAYIVARNYAERHNIKIYNATRGGNLDVFERVDFDSLFL